MIVLLFWVPFLVFAGSSFPGSSLAQAEKVIGVSSSVQGRAGDKVDLAFLPYLLGELLHQEESPVFSVTGLERFPTELPLLKCYCHGKEPGAIGALEDLEAVACKAQPKVHPERRRAPLCPQLWASEGSLGVWKSGHLSDSPTYGPDFLPQDKAFGCDLGVQKSDQVEGFCVVGKA